jgi:hypothetical protein
MNKVAIFFLILGFILLLFFAFWINLSITDETVLYTDTTHNGYEIKIIERGWCVLDNRHRCVLFVNGEEYLNFTIYDPYDTRIFPEGEIICEKDDASSYRLIFCSDYSHPMELCFDADFSKVTRARCYYLEAVAEGLVVEQKTILDWFG